ncbi:MAG: papain-like cysteine protease family protein [Cyanobacteria bacterium P01_D01_bin.156]
MNQSTSGSLLKIKHSYFIFLAFALLSMGPTQEAQAICASCLCTTEEELRYTCPDEEADRAGNQEDRSNWEERVWAEDEANPAVNPEAFQDYADIWSVVTGSHLREAFLRELQKLGIYDFNSYRNYFFRASTRWEFNDRESEIFSIVDQVAINASANRRAEVISEEPENTSDDIENKCDSAYLNDRLFLVANSRLSQAYSQKAFHRKSSSNISIENNRETNRQVAQYPAINVIHNVPYMSQTGRMTCWAASAGMILAWAAKHNVALPDAVVLSLTNPSTAGPGGLAGSNFPAFLAQFGMVGIPAQTMSTADFGQALDTLGPLWVGTANASGNPHVVVVTGMQGDGTPDGTIVIMNDPDPSVGQTSLPYSTFVNRMEQVAQITNNDTYIGFINPEFRDR